MPIHDWMRVDTGTFHGFHTAWLTHMSEALNDGRLPEGYYALPEQHGGRLIADILTLHVDKPMAEQVAAPLRGGLAVADAPPRVRLKRSASAAARSLRKTLAIRHVSGHRIVALVEIVSPSNKDRARHVGEFVAKVTGALAGGVHVTLADLLPPGPHDPEGMDGAVWREVDESGGPYELADGAPFTLASYVADTPIDVYAEHLGLGNALPDMPLFLTPEYYIHLPLEATYAMAFRGMPQIWRDVLNEPSK